MPEGTRTRKCHLPQRPTQARSELLEETYIHSPRVHCLLGRRDPEMPEGIRNHKPHVHHSPGGRNPQVPEGIRTRKRHLQLGPLRPARRTCRAHRAELAGRLVGTAREPAGPTAQILQPEWPRPRPFAKPPRTAGLARSDQGPPLAALRRRGPGPQSPRQPQSGHANALCLHPGARHEQGTLTLPCLAACTARSPQGHSELSPTLLTSAWGTRQHHPPGGRNPQVPEGIRAR